MLILIPLVVKVDHVFGHIHEGYGKWTNGTTTFIYASISKKRGNIQNAPIVFDLPKKRINSFVKGPK